MNVKIIMQDICLLQSINKSNFSRQGYSNHIMSQNIIFGSFLKNLGGSLILSNG